MLSTQAIREQRQGNAIEDTRHGKARQGVSGRFQGLRVFSGSPNRRGFGALFFAGNSFAFDTLTRRVVSTAWLASTRRARSGEPRTSGAPPVLNSRGSSQSPTSHSIPHPHLQLRANTWNNTARRRLEAPSAHAAPRASLFFNGVFVERANRFASSPLLALAITRMESLEQVTWTGQRLARRMRAMLER